MAAAVDRAPEAPEENPLVGYRERFVRDWPGDALRDDGDALFPGGWRRAAADAERDPAILKGMVDGLDDDERARYEREAAEISALAGDLVERESGTPAPPAVPGSVSVSSVIEYARCPKRFYWSSVRPLPQFSGPSARMGTQIHAWIEFRNQAILNARFQLGKRVVLPWTAPTTMRCRFR